MSADISRSTFRPDLNYTAVIAQQGRVQLDADLNEQAAIQRHLLRTLTADLIGPAGGPSGADGFALELVPAEDGTPADLRIGPGRYYVDGVAVQATPPPAFPPAGATEAPPVEPWTYWSQPFAYLDPDEEADRLPDLPVLVYLRVADQVVTGRQDPLLLEKALAGVDTTARLRTVWQMLPIGPDEGFEPPADPTAESLTEAFGTWAATRNDAASGLAVRARQPAGSDADPCLAAPDARYRGPENQYYRFEVHEAGAVKEATLKWSRDNASVVFGIADVTGDWVTLAAPARDDRLDLQVGDWVELGDDATLARAQVRPLWRVVEVDTAGGAVRLTQDDDGDEERPGREYEHDQERGHGHEGDEEGEGPISVDRSRHPFLRRWDHRSGQKRTELQLQDGALLIEEGRWIPVEDGIEIWFAPGGRYRTGDAWSVAARTLDGDVEWPRADDGTALVLPPLEPQVHLAPLAWVTPTQLTDLRRIFPPLG